MAEITITHLNEAILRGAETVMRDEAQYEARISAVADRIAAEGIKVLLLAGPSGAGKTTTANLIADAVRARGLDALVVSLDNFYRDHRDPAYPLLPSGERDYESCDALDLARIRECLSRILRGEDFSIPKYDFKLGRAPMETAHAAMLHGCVIVEGLHALNPAIAMHLPEGGVLRLFVSVSTNIVDESGARLLSGRRIRFLRRLVRDSIFRGADVALTLSLWGSVMEGENKYLYPYKETADFFFDTFHTFEPGVLKTMAAERIAASGIEDPYLAVIGRALSVIEPLPAELVPRSSLIREFIAGGVYEDRY
jgi:uridine kinase